MKKSEKHKSQNRKTISVLVALDIAHTVPFTHTLQAV